MADFSMFYSRAILSNSFSYLQFIYIYQAKLKAEKGTLGVNYRRKS